MPSGSPEVEEAEGAAPVQRLPVVILVLYSVEPHVLQNISDANQLYIGHAIGELLLSIMDEGDFEGIWLKNSSLLTSDNVWKLLVMYLDYSNGLQSYKFHI